MDGGAPRNGPTLSVVILTLNEERNIGDCIDSVRSADEIIVIDSGSTDRTAEIVAAAGARFEVRPLTGFDDQHNHGNEVASSEWVLHLDADERATDALLGEIRSVIASGEADGYRVPTLNIVFGATVKHGGWYPMYHVRLQRRGHARWGGGVHELGQVDGPLGTLREPIIHHSHRDVSAFLVKLDRYTSLEAKGAKGSPVGYALRALLEPGPYFIYKYVIQIGFLDGWRGLVLAMLLALYRCTGYLKALERVSTPRS